MSSRESPFLTAEWRHVAMLNFEIDPAVLRPLVPAGTELDDWRGATFVSIVGLLFRDTRVLGLAIPFHRNFEEVNLRFYVRRRVGDECRRAVVFVKEIVPRAAITWAARALYGENYVTARMGHRIAGSDSGAAGPSSDVSYSWWLNGRENRIELAVKGEPRIAVPGSDVEFITERSWGCVRRRGGRTTEYRVEHPGWPVRAAHRARLDCDVAGIYGAGFDEFLRAAPASAFLAEGSAVAVFRGTNVTA
jgi:uncharacterized protein